MIGKLIEDAEGEEGFLGKSGAVEESQLKRRKSIKGFQGNLFQSERIQIYIYRKRRNSLFNILSAVWPRTVVGGSQAEGEERKNCWSLSRRENAVVSIATLGVIAVQGRQEVEDNRVAQEMMTVAFLNAAKKSK